MKKKLLMITWRDIKSPFAGGAEHLSHNILVRLKNKYDITVWSSAFPNCKRFEKIDGIQYIRMGSKKYNFIGPYNWRVYFTVFRYYWFHERKNFNYDVVIEQINNIPFLFALYGIKNTYLYFNQLCRENWFYQVPKIFAWFGYYIFEPFYLWLLRNKKVIVISKSTKKDLMRFGFKEKNISIIPVATEIKPVDDLKKIKKFKDFSLLSLGNIRSMKRTFDQIKAFEIAKKTIPKLKFYIVGAPGGRYAAQVFDYINCSSYKKDIIYLGYATRGDKIKILQKCHCLLVTSIKEGWGLVVTEAASQGTPAIVYNVDGLRDSVKNNVTGLVVKNNPSALAKKIIKVYQDKSLYKKLQKNAWQWNTQFNFEESTKKFLKIIEH